MLSTRQTLAITGFAGVIGPMMACFTFENPQSALAGLTLPLPFTLAGSLFVLGPTFFALRYSLRWTSLASCIGVLVAGVLVGWLALGGPSNDLLGLAGPLGAWFGGFTAIAWVLGYWFFGNQEAGVAAATAEPSAPADQS
jgi:hypothetical protein